MIFEKTKRQINSFAGLNWENKTFKALASSQKVYVKGHPSPCSFLLPLTALASWVNMQTKGLALHTLSVLHPSPHPRGYLLKSYVGEVLSQVPTPLMCLMATSSYA